VAQVRELYGFRKKGQGVIPVVTAVHPSAIDRFLGAASERERTEHLRGLRDIGVLVHEKNSLRQLVVESDTGWRRKCFVFRGDAWAVPRLARTASGRVRRGELRAADLAADRRK